MTKITKLEQKTYQGKPQGFKVFFDDGRNGNLQEKESDKGLREGDEVFVTEIPYTSKAGVTSTLYGVHLTNGGKTPSGTSQSFNPSGGQKPVLNPPQIHVGAGKSKEEMKSVAAIELIKPFINAYLDGKLESGEIAIKHKEFLALLSSEIDDIFAGK
jgi:hypothetical protein